MRLLRLSREERLLGGLFLLTLVFVNPYIRADGNGYYAYLRSLVIDGDLDFDNEYRRGDPDFVSSAFRRADGHPWPPMRMPTGLLRNQWAVGPAVLWAPSFLQAHGLVLVSNALGLEIAPDGFSRPYRWLCAAATAFYSFVGLLLAYRVAERAAGSTAALLATLALWFASSLPMYMYFLPFHAHALASFAVSLFLWFWLEPGPLREPRRWAVWGALGGLMTAVYHLNGCFLLAAALEWLRGLSWPRAPRSQDAPAPGPHLACGIAFAASALIAALPHFAAKWIVHGSPFDTGRLNRFFWDMPQLQEVGFASEHGLFLWTPVVLAALVGLALHCRRDRFVGAALLAIFAAFYYTVSCYDRWHGVSGFGNRFFVSFTAPFILGLAVLLEEIRSRVKRLRPAMSWAVLSLPVALLVAWNVGLMFQWGTGLVPRRGPVDFTRVVRNQFTAVPRQIASFGLRYLRSRDQVVHEEEQRSINR